MYNRFDFFNFVHSQKHEFMDSYHGEGVNFDYIATVSKKSQDSEDVIYKQFPK